MGLYLVYTASSSMAAMRLLLLSLLLCQFRLSLGNFEQKLVYGCTYDLCEYSSAPFSSSCDGKGHYADASNWTAPAIGAYSGYRCNGSGPPYESCCKEGNPCCSDSPVPLNLSVVAPVYVDRLEVSYNDSTNEFQICPVLGTEPFDAEERGLEIQPLNSSLWELISEEGESIQIKCHSNNLTKSGFTNISIQDNCLYLNDYYVNVLVKYTIFPEFGVQPILCKNNKTWLITSFIYHPLKPTATSDPELLRILVPSVSTILVLIFITCIIIIIIIIILLSKRRRAKKGMVMGPDCYDTIELQSSQDDIWLSFEAQCGRNEPSMNDDCRKKSIYSPRWKRRKLSFEILDDILQMNSFKSALDHFNELIVSQCLTDFGGALERISTVHGLNDLHLHFDTARKMTTLWSVFDVFMLKEMNQTLSPDSTMQSNIVIVLDQYQKTWKDGGISLSLVPPQQENYLLSKQPPQFCFLKVKLPCSPEECTLSKALDVKECISIALKVPQCFVVLAGYEEGSIILWFYIPQRYAEEMSKDKLKVLEIFNSLILKGIQCNWIYDASIETPKVKVILTSEPEPSELEEAAAVARQFKESDLKYMVVSEDTEPVVRASHQNSTNTQDPLPNTQSSRVTDFLHTTKVAHQFLQNCNFSNLHTYLMLSGAISSEECELLSNCQTQRAASDRLYHVLLQDPSTEKLKCLSKVIREQSDGHFNNQKLADMIEEFLGMCSGSSSKTKEGPPLNSFIPVADSGRSNSCPLLTSQGSSTSNSISLGTSDGTVDFLLLA